MPPPPPRPPTSWPSSRSTVEWHVSGGAARRACVDELGWDCVVPRVAVHASTATAPDVPALLAAAEQAEAEPAAAETTTVANLPVLRLHLAPPSLPSYLQAFLRTAWPACGAGRPAGLVAYEVRTREDLAAVVSLLPAGPRALLDVVSFNVDTLRCGGIAGRDGDSFFAGGAEASLEALAKRGVAFEVAVSGGLCGGRGRRAVLIHVLKSLVRVTRGGRLGALVLASGTADPLLLRRPEDYANLLTLAGLPYAEAAKVLRQGSARLLERVRERAEDPAGTGVRVATVRGKGAAGASVQALADLSRVPPAAPHRGRAGLDGSSSSGGGSSSSSEEGGGEDASSDTGSSESAEQKVVAPEAAGRTGGAEKRGAARAGFDSSSSSGGEEEGGAGGVVAAAAAAVPASVPALPKPKGAVAKVVKRVVKKRRVGTA